MRRGLAEIIAGCDDGVREVAFSQRDLRDELAELDRRIESEDRPIREIFRSEPCETPRQIEALGPITATALPDNGDGIDSAFGDGTCFKNSRQFAAWLGLLCEAASSGGPARLSDIRKRGTVVWARLSSC
ncbi:MAG: IS110 family transposase [Mesorhizobium sp.]|uniref:transposase n=1 Tax=Mesorhizobium sp. TaxID=1871066 RepID=UPI00120AE2F3|nr:transposase [Mesorhizobium sp.]TIR02496.1 MAG: IS110 family transposase [Mesorhizobium sp.]